MGMFRMSGKLAVGLMVSAACALPQAYTISAKPGAVNYIEGAVQVNGKTVSSKTNLRVFLAANDTLTTGEASRAEILLTPGVFVRVGADSQVKMISPRLIDTQVEIQKGEADVEVGELEKDNSIRVTDSGATAMLQKTGLYRFTAANPGAIQVLEGEAAVEQNGRKLEIKKDHELVLAGDMKPQHFDPKSAEDDLYAWSKVRDEYESASSLVAARSVNVNNSFTSFGGWGGGYYAPGWFWNTGWNSWAWLPGNGAFFSPFGFGYFSPIYAMYAPVVYAPLYAGGIPVAVPVNPNRPVQIAGVTSKPAPIGGVQLPGGHWPVSAAGGRVSSATIAAHAAAAPSGGYSGGASVGSSASVASSTPHPSGGMSAGHASAGGGHH